VNLRILTAALLASWLAVPGEAGQAAPASAREMYAAALTREQAVRVDRTATLKEYRSAVNAYDALVRSYPASGYVDNALWQGGVLALEAFERYGEARDQATARRLFELLAEQYRFSPLSSKAREALRRMDAKKAPPEAAPAPPPAAPAKPLALVKDVRRTTMGDRVRVTIELDAPAPYRAESVENPRRMFVDIGDTRLGGAVAEGTLTYDEEVVRKVRVGRHPNQTTRVVVDLDGIRRYSVSTLTNPFRILVDCERVAAAAPPTPAPPTAAPAAAPPAPAPIAKPPAPTPAPRTPVVAPRQPLESRPLASPWSETAAVPPKPLPPPPAPPAESTAPAAPPKAASAVPIPSPGPYSLSRQLGLGASRIVIDPGHGGHDPGALGPDVSEAEVVLDVALRLEALLRDAGFEVVLTRRTDEFVPLEERPAIATRERADLFLSIHANASRNRTARGIETYILNFATDPDAVAVAVRENASTERRMNNLPEIVKAITLNNKLDESRSFAGLVQRAMAQQLREAGGIVVDHGIKQAPFVVLIGAAMPSVLVEISFITNTQEGRLLKTPAYRQRVAQALYDGIRGYQKSLKLVPPTQQD
jgi:N-acetylmuramoyl-L-alanine amidase